MLRYSELTGEQKDRICNGCGGKGSFINVPEFLFHASCDHHDFLYWRGGDESDRELADKAFYKYMKKDVATATKWWLRSYYGMWAWSYYKAVRLFGAKYFSYK